jgi:hypothetical protein
MASGNAAGVVAGVTTPESHLKQNQSPLGQLFRNSIVDLDAAVSVPLRGIGWADQQPFLYFRPPTILSGGSSVTFTIGPGTLWLQVNRFVPNVQASDFAGLKIETGKSYAFPILQLFPILNSLIYYFL